MLEFRSISTKLLAVIIPIVVISGLIVISYEARNTYLEQISKLDDQLQSIVQASSSDLSRALWEIDRQKIETIAQKMAVLTDVNSVSVYDSSGKLIVSAGVKNTVLEDTSFRRMTDLFFIQLATKYPVGRIEIIGNRDKIVSAVIEFGRSDGLLLFSVFVILIITTIFSVRRFIGRPLELLHNEISKEIATQKSGRIDWKSSDELGAVVNVFNEFQDYKMESIRKILAYQADLEEEIKERTHAEKELIDARNELEVRVEQRTAELRQEIIERENAEDKLRNAEKMQALGTLAGGIAHNFNNALVPIRALSELLMMQLPKDSPDHETLNEIVGGAKRAQDLVAQIMSFSRQDEGKQENIDPCELLQGAMALINPIAPSNIKIIERIDTDVGEVRANKAQIESVFMNMASNAFDAMEGKQGKLEVSLSQIELDKNVSASDTDLEAGSYAKFQFSDTGSGMDEDCMKRIFDPFFTTKEVGRGTGLGLSTVHGIVTGFGGAVEVSSEIGVGTTFDIYFPLVAKDVENEISAKGN